MTKMQRSIIMIVITFALFLLNVNSVQVGASAPKAAVNKQELVLVRDYSNSIAIEMKYATCDNFVQKTLYPSPTCVLAKGTLDKLINANKLLNRQGYTIKIWDAYRPLSVQKIMWDATPNKNYVANPYRSGSKHNRGAAVDVTLVDKTGKEVQMPTGFDNFTAKAAPSYSGMTAEQRKNLNLLSKAMTSAGFKPLSTEWWHFEDTDFQNYKIQDIPLGKFDKTNYKLSSNVISNLRCIKSNTSSQQLITVTSVLSNTSNVVINTYEKQKNGWTNIHKNITGCIGLKGFTTNKAEGDKKTPSGVFSIGSCFSKTNGIPTGLDFYKYDSKDVWVDDPVSEYYNTHQREPSNGRWKSAENFSKMKNGVYDVFFNINYNTVGVKNKGSAIFFHIFNTNAQLKYTNGCVATDRKNLLAIVKWLDKDKKPLIIQGTLSDVVKY